MKILQVIFGFGGGGENKVALDLVKGLTSRGHEVQIVRVNVPYDNQNEKRILTDLVKLGVKEYCLNRESGAFSFRSFNQFLKIVKREKYDIIHSHLFIPDIYSALAQFLTKKSSIHFITLHNTVIPHKKVVVQTLFRNSIFIKCSPVIGSPNSRIETITIPNSVDINKWRPIKDPKLNLRKNLKIEIESFIVLLVGNLRKQKNQIEALKTLQILKSEYKVIDIHFIICGEGEKFESLSTFVTDYRLNDCVHFLGLRDDVDKIINASDLYLSTSLWEGMPLAVLEALSSGIVTLLSPIKEHEVIAKDFSDCHLASSHEPKAYAKLIWEIYKKRNEKCKLTTFNEREKMLSKYSNDSFCNSHEELYSKYLTISD
jgi:glycosyltransferase involved in cell wall biosynthesis